MNVSGPLETRMEGQNLNLKQNRLHRTAQSAISIKAESHAITLHLIEDEVTTDYLKDKIRYITPEQYEDVVTERAINEICGYPLCPMKLAPQYSTQTYIIRHNKVYDVTQRKNFCSDICYEASNIIANQVPKVPLYLRRSDQQIRSFELYIPELSTLHGRYGRLVNIKGLLEDVEDSIATQKLETKEFSSDFKEKKSKFSMEKNTVGGPCDTKDSKKMSNTQSSIPTENDKDLCKSSIISEDINSKTEAVMKDNKHKKFKKKQIHNKKFSEKNSSEGVKNLDFNNEAPNNSKNFNLLLEVEQQMRQWMTFESLRLILGDKYVRGMLEELGKTWEDYDSTAGLSLTLESKSRYIDLCKKLDSMEIEEEIYEKNVVSLDHEANIASKPLPNFDQLKKDVDDHAIKVKAFFEGKEEFATNVQDNNLDTINEEKEEVKESSDLIKGKEPKPKGNRRKQKDKKVDFDPDVEFVTLPLIDTYTQTSWRRIIVLEKISKPIAFLSCEFGLDEGQIRNLLKPLIASFDFTSRNIIFRVTQWDFVALIFLKMLSIRYPIINEAMQSEKGYKVINSLLVTADLDAGYLDRLLTYLTEIVHILSKHHKNNNCSVDNKCSDVAVDKYNRPTTSELGSSSNVNFDGVSKCLLDNEKETTNPSQVSKSKDLEKGSSEICEDLCPKDLAKSLSPPTFKSEKNIDTKSSESCIDNVLCDTDNRVNKIKNIKDYIDVREIITKTDDNNFGEKLSTNMEDLD